MKNIAKTFIILTLFAFGSFTVLGNTAQAAFPTILAATANIGTTEVELNGSVNPNGYLTTAWFEYGTANDLGGFKETTHLDIGAGTESSQFSGSITDLAPGTTYYFRVTANNGQRIIKSEILPFTTKVSIAPITSTTLPKEDIVDTPKIEEETKNAPNPIEIKEELKNTTTKDNTGLEANTVFGVNPDFLPTNLTGWLLLVLVILCILFIGRKLFGNNSTRIPRTNL